MRTPNAVSALAQDAIPGRKDCKAFTLVELLVVIGIIALLISILLPSLNKARQAANSVACASNMRQIGIGMLMYASEHHGCVPAGYLALPNNPGGNPPTYTNWRITWEDEVAPYVAIKLVETGGPHQYLNFPAADARDIPLFRCPEDNIIMPAAGSGLGGGIRKTYSLNRGRTTDKNYFVGMTVTGVQLAVGSPITVPNPSIDPPYFRYIKLTEARNSASTILVVEHVTDQNIFGYCNTAGQGVTDNPGQQLSFLKKPLHSGKFNYLMCDGHVELLNALTTYGTGTLNNPKGMWSRAVGD